MRRELEEKKSIAIDALRRTGGVVVALSGGVDSGVLLALAIEALGPGRVVAVTGHSASLASDELEDARAVAAALGADHEVVATHEMARPGFRTNAGDRCYHCRTELFEILETVARRRGLATIAYGAIADDLAADRPGMKAAAERGISAPLVEAGLHKPDVRALAIAFGLPVGDKPATPCLASRIPAGTPVTPEKLDQIERAEAALRGLGFTIVRVRHHGEIARLELDGEGMQRIADPVVRERMARAVRAAGFRFVALDLEGYRSGSVSAAGPPLYRIAPARDGGQ